MKQYSCFPAATCRDLSQEWPASSRWWGQTPPSALVRWLLLTHVSVAFQFPYSCQNGKNMTAAGAGRARRRVAPAGSGKGTAGAGLTCCRATGRPRGEVAPGQIPVARGWPHGVGAGGMWCRVWRRLATSRWKREVDGRAGSWGWFGSEERESVGAGGPAESAPGPRRFHK